MSEDASYRVAREMVFLSMGKKTAGGNDLVKLYEAGWYDGILPNILRIAC
jgi:hypothetical protein